MSEEQTKMVSIWFLVSLVMGTFGVIVLGSGIYDAINPGLQTSVLAELNPSLWWGAIMVVFSLLLFFGDRVASKRGS